jgi:hypothetical protein
LGWKSKRWEPRGSHKTFRLSVVLRVVFLKQGNGYIGVKDRFPRFNISEIRTVL